MERERIYDGSFPCFKDRRETVFLHFFDKSSLLDPMQYTERYIALTPRPGGFPQTKALRLRNFQKPEEG